MRNTSGWCSAAWAFRGAFFDYLLSLLLLRVIFRRPWLAGIAFVVFHTFINAYDAQLYTPSLVWPLLATTYLVVLGALVRFGVLAVIVQGIAWDLLWNPMTTDPSREYFASGLLALGIIIGIALYGAFIAIGGRRFFEKGFAGDG